MIGPLQETIAKKDTSQAVKQEIEKNDELKRSALRTVVVLGRIPEADTNATLNQLMLLISGVLLVLFSIYLISFLAVGLDVFMIIIFCSGCGPSREDGGCAEG